MTEEDMQQALLQLANEMTSSIETANVCISDMDLQDEDELYEVAKYLKQIVYMANGNA